MQAMSGATSSDQGDDVVDTVTRARQTREAEGSCEVEVSYGGEVDLHRHLLRCPKNPGHVDFVPIHQFTADRLPFGYQDNDLVGLIRAKADLTVRVSVKYVSEERPTVFPGSDIPFPCYKNRGGNMIRTGTGWVSEVFKFPDEDAPDYTCKCAECLKSPTPKTEFAHITLRTAAHVVYDIKEAADTTCHLFYNQGNKPDLCEGVVALTGMFRASIFMDTDMCELTYVTHDICLADRLQMLIFRFSGLLLKVKKKFQPRVSDSQISPPQTDSVPNAWDKLTIIVSHPHGCSKQVSFGHYVDRYVTKGEGGHVQFTYTTATCPGSSGSHVLVLGRDWGILWANYVHSGNFQNSKGLNHSSYGLDIEPQSSTQNVSDHPSCETITLDLPGQILSVTKIFEETETK